MTLDTSRSANTGIGIALVVCGGVVAAQAAGIPSARGVDHVGMTVPNLKQAIAFFTDVLGCEHIYTAGPFNDPKGEWMKTNLAVHPRAAATFAMVRCGATQNVELFEYEAPDEVTTPPRNSDVGGGHLAFLVDDLDKAVAYLKSVPGVKILGTPTPVSNQPNGGEVFLYFQTPWGATMEVLQYQTLDYEKTTTKRLFRVK